MAASRTRATQQPASRTHGYGLTAAPPPEGGFLGLLRSDRPGDKAVGLALVLAIVGYVDHKLKSEIDLEMVHGKRLQVFGVSNAFMSAADRAEAMRGFIRDLLPGFAEGKMAPIVDKVFPFHDLSAAKAYMESDAQLGKVVVSVP